MNNRHTRRAQAKQSAKSEAANPVPASVVSENTPPVPGLAPEVLAMVTELKAQKKMFEDRCIALAAQVSGLNQGLIAAQSRIVSLEEALKAARSR